LILLSPSPELFEGDVTFDYAREKIYINGVEHGIENGLKVIAGSLNKDRQDI
jgi:hypothetical protein